MSSRWVLVNVALSMNSGRYFFGLVRVEEARFAAAAVSEDTLRDGGFGAIGAGGAALSWHGVGGDSVCLFSRATRQVRMVAKASSSLRVRLGTGE